MRQSKEQITRLVSSKVVGDMFLHLGGTPSAVSVTHKLQKVQELVKPYKNRDWSKLRSVIKFIGLISSSLQDSVREHVICILLRLSGDRMIFDSVDNLDLVQEVMFRLCRDIREESWDSFVSQNYSFFWERY